MSRIVEKLLMWAAALFYGFRVLIAIVRMCVQVGPRRVFHWRPVARPAALDDPSLGTHGYLSLDNDVKIHYVVSGPEDGPLLLFVHGFPEFWYSWRHQIREFQKDYRVVAIDQRGYGDSSKPHGIDEYGIKKLMGDLKRVIVALGYSKCVLVGHDWGGVVCWAFGRLFPDKVERLIVMNCPPRPVALKIMKTSAEQRRMSWYMLFFQLPYLPELYCKVDGHILIDNVFGNRYIGSAGFPKAFENSLGPEDIQAYKYTFSQPGALTPPLNYYRAMLLRGRGGLVDYDMDFAVPVLLIWGVKDVALSLAMAEVIEKEYPKICVRKIQEAGHFVQMDRPDLVNAAMREWLGK